MTHDQAPGVNAPTRCAKEANDPLFTGEAHLRPAPILTRNWIADIDRLTREELDGED